MRLGRQLRLGSNVARSKVVNLFLQSEMSSDPHKRWVILGFSRVKEKKGYGETHISDEEIQLDAFGGQGKAREEGNGASITNIPNYKQKDKSDERLELKIVKYLIPGGSNSEARLLNDDIVPTVLNATFWGTLTQVVTTWSRAPSGRTVLKYEWFRWGYIYSSNSTGCSSGTDRRERTSTFLFGWRSEFVIQ